MDGSTRDTTMNDHLLEDVYEVGVIVLDCAKKNTFIDYIIITSDSGRITIVEFLPAQNKFSRLHLETFGKSGVRRVIPGQYLAVDPKGRACLISSVEKNKLVYVLNRNAQAELTT